MDLQTFINLRPTWGQEPCLYIIKSDASSAFRCGASGTFLHKDADLVYGAEKAQLTGLLGRCNMYKNFWLPVKGKIYAALRVKRQLVATSKHRTNEDSQGNKYNISKGNHTLVLAKEAELHALLDKKNYRWKDPATNQPTESELFQTSVQNLIATLRQIQGEEMYIFDSNSYKEDTAYRGGKSHQDIVLTKPKQQQPRLVKEGKTLQLKMTKNAIEQLKMGDPDMLEKLVDLLEETKVVKLKKEDIEKLRQGDPTTIKAIKEAARMNPRRSSRLKS